jgi:hypothetical protein
MPVTAGMVDKAQMATGVTGFAMTAQRSGTAVEHGAHHTRLLRGNAIRGQPVGGETPEDLGKRSGHGENRRCLLTSGQGRQQVERRLCRTG